MVSDRTKQAVVVSYKLTCKIRDVMEGAGKQFDQMSSKYRSASNTARRRYNAPLTPRSYRRRTRPSY